MPVPGEMTGNLSAAAAAGVAPGTVADAAPERPEMAPGRPGAAGRFAGAVGRGLLGGLVLAGLLELTSRLGVVSPEYLPPATAVLRRMAELAADPGFLGDLGATLLAWAMGLGLAVLVSVPLGILLGASDLAYRVTMPLIEFMRPIPSVVLIPLAILVLGQGLGMKLALTAYAASWPILYNTVFAVHAVDPVALDTARAFGLPRAAVLRRVVLPSAAPLIATGLRISASVALIVVVGAELLAAATSGVGSFILNASNGGGDMVSVLAGAAYSGLLGLAINLVIGGLEARAFGWRSLRGAA